MSTDQGCQDGTDPLDSVACPAYANAGCYTAAGWHQSIDLGDNDAEVVVIEEDYRGCSSFSPTTTTLGCDNFVVTGAQYNVCKDLCTTADCNNEKIERVPQCHQCNIKVDSMNNTIGIGDERYCIYY